MARIAGVDIPNKHVDTALTYIYGIGRSSAKKICEEAKIDPLKMMNDLSQEELTKLRHTLQYEANSKTMWLFARVRKSVDEASCSNILFGLTNSMRLTSQH